MKKRILSIISIISILTVIVCVRVFAVTNNDGTKYTTGSPTGFYHCNHYETGITLANSLNPDFEGATMDVEVITEGDLYDKYAALFDGDIILYDISVTNNGKNVEVTYGDSYLKLIIPDEEYTSEKTADIYHVNNEGEITKLPTAREWLSDANYAGITSLGLFIRAEGTIIGDTVLIPYSPIPTFTPKPTDTPIPTAKIPPLGDINIDFVVNSDDALLVLKSAAKLETLSYFATGQADINKDKIVDANDALEILKYAARLIETL